jgi:AraC-like DNA-binding protein/quercetin dioxygenase-like cupin family protein
MKAIYEKIIPLEANSFKAYSYTKKEFDAPWHYHPEYELTYIVSSQGVRYTGNSFENFKENDFVLLGPNLPHCWKNAGKQTQKASAIVIHWDHNLLGNNWTEKREFQTIRKLLMGADKGILFDTDIAGSVKPKLDHFLTLSSFDKLIALLEILHELSLTKKTKTLCDRSFKDELNLDDHDRINMIYHYVRAHYAKKFSLTDIANEVHMGAESFSRFFSKTMNKPFFSFLNEYRINAACKLLIESDLPVTEICYACGFESLPFFYRQFKKYKGNSPHQYRMAYQKISIV